jgi:hypothetical protein
VLTIRHKHHGHKHKHGRTYNHHKTTSFDTPSSENDRASIQSSHSLLSHAAVPIKEVIQKYKQISVNTSSMMTHSTRPKSRQYNSSNSVKTEEVERSNSSDSLTDKRLALSDNTTEHHHPVENPSFELSRTNATVSFANNEYHITDSINEVEQSASDNKQLHLSKESNKINLSRNNTGESKDSNINLIGLEKKILRINHYPNMLADFD